MNFKYTFKIISCICTGCFFFLTELKEKSNVVVYCWGYQQSQQIEQMKHMTCVNHKQALEVCINPECKAACAYLCLERDDSCRGEHQACPLVSLGYLNRKSYKIVAKAHDFQIQKLITLNSTAKKIIESVDNFLQNYHLLSAIKDILDPHGLLEPKQKETILSFLGSKIKDEREVSLPSLERDLGELQVEIGNYVQLIQQERRKYEEKEDKREGQRRSSIKSKVMQSPSAVKSGLKEPSELPGLASKIKQSKISQRKESAIVSSSLKQKQKQLESAIRVEASSLRRHVPKPPFFSKITNDIQTINTFFYHKFADVKLLYRASENQFSAGKFHQKCDQITNTITLVLTEGEKIVGGFTPLPWKSGGGQWYADNAEATFLFSLSSGERYPLVNKDKAIWCSRAFGPSFGYPDLQISDKAFYNSNSCANFPQCFNNGNYTSSTGSTQMFCGSKNGHFKIKEWEVYQLMF